jgi:large subunit ribosomal protein L10
LKEQVIDDLKAKLSKATVVVVAHNLGLSVADSSELRRRMRASGASFRVAKNTLARRAVADTPYSGLAAMLKGPTALAFSQDPVAAAKVAVDFAKKNEKFVILGGSLGATALSAAGVEQLSKLPSIEELRGKIVGLIVAPATRIAGVLAQPGARLARVFAAYGSSAKDAAA